MNTIANNLPLISVSLLSAWLIAGAFFHLPKIKSISVNNRLVIVLFVLVFVRYMPVYEGMNIAYILRGIVGNLSITSVLLVLTFLYSEIWGDNNDYRINNGVWLIIFIIDFVLCLSAFGCIPVDIYSTGYYPKGLLIFYFIVQVLFWLLNREFAMFWLLALVGYIFKVLPSPNLWDYLIDPVIWLISLVYLIIFGVQKLINNFFNK